MDPESAVPIYCGDKKTPPTSTITFSTNLATSKGARSL